MTRRSAAAGQRRRRALATIAAAALVLLGVSIGLVLAATQPAQRSMSGTLDQDTPHSDDHGQAGSGRHSDVDAESYSGPVELSETFLVTQTSGAELTAYRSADGLCVELGGVRLNGGGGGCGFGVERGQAHLGFIVTAMGNGSTYAYGPVSPETAKVMVYVADGHAITINPIPGPAQLGDIGFYMAEARGVVESIVALDEQGRVLETVDPGLDGPAVPAPRD